MSAECVHEVDREGGVCIVGDEVGFSEGDVVLDLRLGKLEDDVERIVTGRRNIGLGAAGRRSGSIGSWGRRRRESLKR